MFQMLANTHNTVNKKEYGVRIKFMTDGPEPVDGWHRAAAGVAAVLEEGDPPMRLRDAIDLPWKQGEWQLIERTYRFPFCPKAERIWIENEFGEGRLLRVDEFRVKTVCRVSLASNQNLPGVMKPEFVANSGVTFDPATGKLTFTPSFIGALDMDGDGVTDSQYQLDPLAQGASVKIEGFTFDREDPERGGLWFKGGRIGVEKDGLTSMEGDMPQLFLNDESRRSTGFDMFGELDVPESDSESESQFLWDMEDFYRTTPYWLSLFVATGGNFEQEIRAALANPLADPVSTFADIRVSFASPIPGDANKNGIIDDDDLSLLLAHWDQDVTGDPDGGWGKGEFDAIGPVSDGDLSLLLANWTGPVGGGAIPEPATLSLPAAGAMVLLRHKRRR